ncbi:hypothetical protein BDR04DRAFT_1126777 [Suillus decipiens]|nr:hypothetical protein BDR04DRAFT_1126777 [Suillus decipiens]
MSSGSPDGSCRQTALPWTPGDVSENATEALQALDTYKKKEPLKAEDPLFTYINPAFSPASDDTVSNLYKSFATEVHLIVNYSTTAAWG